MYKNKIHKSNTLETDLSDKESTAAEWGANNGERTKQSIDQMAKDLAKQMAAQLTI
jgi:hypothetical protein